MSLFYAKSTEDKKRKDGKPETENLTVFGAPLQRAVAISQIDPNLALPAIVQQAILFLNKRGLDEEGLFRVPGSTIKVNNLKQMYNSGQKFILEDVEKETHNIAGLLKLYFRELPEPLLTRDLAAEFNNALSLQSEKDKIATIKGLLDKLPKANITVLTWLVNHLVRVSKFADVNRMSISNLGVVFSPCLDIPPLLFKIFLTDVSQLFSDPFDDEHNEKNKVKVKEETKPVNEPTSDDPLVFDELDELEISLGGPIVTKNSSNPPPLSSNEKKTPPVKTSSTASTASTTTNSTNSTTTTTNTKVENETSLDNFDSAQQLEDLDSIMDSLNQDLEDFDI